MTFDEFHAGQVLVRGPATVDEVGILAFAREYDPQWFHVDPSRARQGVWNGLIASGWQTCGIIMRLMCDGYLLESACMGSPGLDEVKWLKPVRPGDALRLRATALEQTASQKDPGRGSVKFSWEALNQAGEVVCRVVGRQYFKRR